RAVLPFFGPAVIASVAYMDPGNFATNIESGASFGYQLLWVVLVANLIAMLFQSLSAKLGIVTGKSLATQCRDNLPKPLVYVLWVASEVAAMATDVAEFIGGGLGVSLLLGIPLMHGLVVTGIVTYLILTLQRSGFRPMEIVIGAFVAIIGVSYIIELLIASPNWGLLATGMVTPHLANGHAVTLAVGVVGATVMPHAIYLHSTLTRDRVPPRNDMERRRILNFSNLEVLVALGFAGFVNLAMMTMAAVVFHGGHDDVASIETAYRTLTPLLGAGAASVFMVSLIASGFSSSVVGTMAGQTIMQDFVAFRIPLWVRRVVTMAPSFAIVAYGVSSIDALIVSQVVLSLVLPVPMIALVYFTSRRDVMGAFANARWVTAGAIAATVVVLALNVVLLAQTLGVVAIGG
ncbi:MAG: Nramp family divalent metal transporter, partial [Ancalomicrobiaceae bacterium]|nr:Nramp family divalent metal transporter [Ancalomicrobiaceae bacterium]